MPARPTTPRTRLTRAVREFLKTEAAGGVVLLVAAVVALALANSPWSHQYEDFWHTKVGSLDLHHWVNDLLMAVFFLVVGLEIKREIVAGELRSWKVASVPAIAAVGGMVVPAGLYVLFNVGGEGSAGWGIPMATDIAFAVGVLSLLGTRAPAGLKLFLLTLAIVDDIGAIAVIAIFYSDNLDLRALGAAAAVIAIIIVLRRLRVEHPAPYIVLAAALWFAVFESGVHATIAGVVMGLLVRARTKPEEHASPAERAQHVLHPWSSFLIIPLFALANAGVPLGGGIESGAPTAVALGIIVGLVVGKPLGVTLGAWLAVRMRIGTLPEGVGWGDLVGGAALAGIGFTVSLFVAGLAFDDAALTDAASLAILLASVVASVGGAVLVYVFPRPARRT
jgi:NhaA family Na+:H+ antiporter